MAIATSETLKVRAARTPARRVLLLTQYFEPEVGAAQTRTSAIVKWLASQGVETEVITSQPNYPLGRILPGHRRWWWSRDSHASARVHRCPVVPATGSGIARGLNYLSFAVSSSLALVSARPADVVLVESPPLSVALVGSIYTTLRRRPMVLMVADLWPDALIHLGVLDANSRFAGWLRRLERELYGRAALVTTVLPELRDTLTSRCVGARAEVDLLPNGVDVSTFHPGRAERDVLSELGLPGGRWLLYAGTMGLAHGLEPLMHAMNELQRRPDAEDVHLLMIGGGSDRSRLESIVAAHKISNVHFRDPIKPTELAVLARQCSIGVVTAADIELNKNARPAKLFPLMASGLPVLHAGPGFGAVAVEDARAGMVSENSPGPIVTAVMAMLAAPCRESWGLAGREFVERHYSWATIIEAWWRDVERASGLESATR